MPVKKKTHSKKASPVVSTKSLTTLKLTALGQGQSLEVQRLLREQELHRNIAQSEAIISAAKAELGIVETAQVVVVDSPKIQQARDLLANFQTVELPAAAAVNPAALDAAMDKFLVDLEAVLS